MTELQNIEELIAQGMLDEAITLLDAIVAAEESNDRALYLRGRARWRKGDRSGATCDYTAAVEINPASPASRALEQAREIEAFFNPDLYNP